MLMEVVVSGWIQSTKASRRDFVEWISKEDIELITPTGEWVGGPFFKLG